MASYSTACLVVLAALACASTSIANDKKVQKRTVQAALLLHQQPEPIIAETTCETDSKCKIITFADWELEIAITLPPPHQSNLESAELEIDCPGGCSFRSGRSYVTLQRERRFDLFSGVEPRNLVHMRRPMIGELALIIEDDELVATKAKTLPTTDN